MSGDDSHLTVPPPATDALVEGHADLTLIGRGGSADVYRATELAFERPVAIKIFSARLRADDDVREFRRECLAIGRVGSHPNIVRVFAAGRTRDGRPFLSMELMEGSLADELPPNGLPPGRVLRAGIALAGAVATAHQAGVLHRDIKPENVLLSRFDDVSLADFGVAKVMSHTTDSSLGLTLRHAAPEVLAGEPATEQSDVYSLASTLYELLTGAAPFGGPDTRGSMRKLVTDPPSMTVAHLPEGLQDCLLRALSRDPSERPATMEELGHQLEEIASRSGMVGASMVLLAADDSPVVDAVGPDAPAGEPTSDPADTDAPGVGPTGRRLRRPALLTAAAVVVAVSVLVAVLQLRQGPATTNASSGSGSSTASTLPESPEALIQLVDQRIAAQTPSELDVGRACVTSRLSLLNERALRAMLTLGPGTTENISAVTSALDDCVLDRAATGDAILSGRLGIGNGALAGAPEACVRQELSDEDAFVPLAVQLLGSKPSSPVVDRLAAEQVAMAITACLSDEQLIEVVQTSATDSPDLPAESRDTVLACAATVVPQMSDLDRQSLSMLLVRADGLPEPLQRSLRSGGAQLLTSLIATYGQPVVVTRTETGDVTSPPLVCRGSSADLCSQYGPTPDGEEVAPEVC